MAQSAVSQDDWTLVSNQWKQAIAFLQQVPNSHAQHSQVKNKITEYERYLAVAQEEANQAIASLPAEPEVTPTEAEPITETVATESSTTLSDLLSQHEVVLYRTYWCPVCSWQEQILGESINQVELVECDPAGENAQPERCNAANVVAYPTWQIDGQTYRGGLSLPELASLLR
jgi:hypothetical protein